MWFNKEQVICLIWKIVKEKNPTSIQIQGFILEVCIKLKNDKNILEYIDKAYDDGKINIEDYNEMI